MTRNTDSSAAEKLRLRGVEMVAGDFFDQDSLLRAASDVDTIFTMTTPFEQGVEVKLLRASPQRMPLRRPGWANPIKKHKPKYLSTIKIQNQHRLK